MLRSTPRSEARRQPAAQIQPLDPGRLQRLVHPDHLRLVGDVALVERLRPRHLRVAEPVLVARRRDDDVGAAARAAAAGVGSQVVDGQVQRAGTLHPLRDQLGGHVGDHARVVVAGSRAVADRLAVVGDLEVVIARVECRVPVVVAGGGLEAVRDGLLVALEVLADPGGAVAGVPHPDRQRVVDPLHVLVAAGVREDAAVVRVVAGQVGDPRRAAERRRDDVILENRPGIGEQPECPRHVAGLELGEVLVVGVDHDHVGLVARGLRRDTLGPRVLALLRRLRLAGAAAGAEGRGERHEDQREGAGPAHRPEATHPPSRDRRPQGPLGTRPRADLASALTR